MFVIPTQMSVPPGPEEDLESVLLLQTEYTMLPAPFPMAPSIREQQRQQQQQQQGTAQFNSNKALSAPEDPTKKRYSESGLPPRPQDDDDEEDSQIQMQSHAQSQHANPNTLPLKNRTKKHSREKSNIGLLGTVYDVDGGENEETSNQVGLVPGILTEASLSGDLYAPLVERLRLEKITVELQKGLRLSQTHLTSEQQEVFAELLKEYQLTRKKELCTKLVESEREEKNAIEFLQQISSNHASLENRIRPQMKQLLYQQTRLEYFLNCKLEQLSERQLNGMMNDLSYYQKYIKELNQTLQAMNTVRSKCETSIRQCLQTRVSYETAIRQNRDKTEQLQQKMQTQMNQFVSEIKKLLPETKVWSDKEKKKKKDFVKNSIGEQFNWLNVFNILSDFEKSTVAKSGDSLVNVLSAEDERLTHEFGLLAFRLSTIPTFDYVNRLTEIFQLSYIYQHDKLKEFFQYFVRFAIQTFIELSYAHSCFVENNQKAITEQLPRMETIKYIAELTHNQSKNNQSGLQKELAIIQQYLEKLPDRDAVVGQVGRHLTADVTVAAQINAAQELQIPILAKQRVKDWIAAIVGGFDKQTKNGKDEKSASKLLQNTNDDTMAHIDVNRATGIVLNQKSKRLNDFFLEIICLYFFMLIFLVAEFVDYMFGCVCKCMYDFRTN
ncbi:hypothetical protein RFI_10496 [Reticulomyxa filosa]|uniref:Uncharacterized protein n=1 Tax=Reticulomyxa filosa TaxID=46433 RepID=X6NMK9_RETFI|nr:hypothetical protein RFI_10496 [Reticulomyxa filosa]|eukprot:ETO26637.1 hypothetical protein RFI_10496 [Reticulomyxa filosa]